MGFCLRLVENQSDALPFTWAHKKDRAEPLCSPHCSLLGHALFGPVILPISLLMGNSVSLLTCTSPSRSALPAGHCCCSPSCSGLSVLPPKERGAGRDRQADSQRAGQCGAKGTASPHNQAGRGEIAHYCHEVGPLRLSDPQSVQTFIQIG